MDATEGAGGGASESRSGGRAGKGGGEGEEFSEAFGTCCSSFAKFLFAVLGLVLLAGAFTGFNGTMGRIPAAAESIPAAAESIETEHA